MITNIGNLSIAGAIPGLELVAVAGVTGITSALPDIQARLAALQAWTPQPFTFAAHLALAEGTLASIQAGITAGLPLPDLSAQIAMIAALIAALLAQIQAINLQLELIADFQSLFGVSGVYTYAFNGAASAFGPEFGSELGVFGGQTARAIVLFTTAPEPWNALAQIMKVTP